MQDIVPKKSIREITKPHAPRAASVQSEYKDVDFKKPTSSKPSQAEEYPHTKFEPVTKEKGRGWGLIWFIIILLVGVGTYLHLQKSVTVHITKKEHVLTFKNTTVSIPAQDVTTLTANATSTISIKTSTGTPTLTKAKGTVTIFNANTTEQVLVANTRLETPNGKIYRLDSKVTVPKASTTGGKTVPGSAQASITADKTGESYNAAQSDFTFPGLLGSPRYKNVYARTKSSIIGGKETSARVVDEKDKDSKINLLISEKENVLKQGLETQEQENTFSLQKPTITSTFEKLSDTEGLVTLKISEGVVDSKKLATILTRSQKQNTTNTMDFGKDTAGLSIEYVSKDSETMTLKIDGVVTVQEYVDENAVKSALTGKAFNQFREIIQQFEGIQETRFSSKPFWIKTFPKIERIIIEQK